MIRVAHLHRVTGIAGSEKHLLTLLPRLRDAAILPSMIVLEPRPGQASRFVKELEDSGIETETVPMGFHFDPVAIGRLARVLRRRRPDIVHTHLIHADIHGLLAARVAGGSRIVSSRHNPDAFRTHPLVRRAMTWHGRHCDRIICISEGVRQFAEAIERIPAAKLTTIHYGYDPGAQRPAHGIRESLELEHSEFVIGIVARLTEQKGHETLLRAMTRVRQHAPAVRLVVIGDGRLRTELPALARALDLTDVVAFLGHRPDAARLMGAFDVFAHPSRWEGFGMVFLEAMEASVPIVATTVGAIPEIVHHMETGVLVPPDAPDALADALLLLVRDRDLARRMGNAGRARLEAMFPVERMVQRTATVYREIISSAPNGARASLHYSVRPSLDERV